MIDKAFFELNPARSVIAIGWRGPPGIPARADQQRHAAIISDTRAIYAALLSPQGKFAYDLLLVGSMANVIWSMRKARAAPISSNASSFSSCAPR